MTHSSLISIENLFQTWEEFKCGKRNKRDVQVFERHLEDNLFDLHLALKNKSYKHGGYLEFYVNDPKRRHIHKAQVCDRIVHHLLYKYLYSLFDKTFIYDSYSCRLDKGTHRAVRRLEKYTRIVSRNYTNNCWALKLDIKKFFDSIDHRILLKLIAKSVNDHEILSLVKIVIDSYSSSVVEKLKGEVLDKTRTISVRQQGIPLGNLTSQIFANIYLNGLDQFIKHNLKIKYYLRYADDFLTLNNNRQYLHHCFETLQQFLSRELKLEIHPAKVSLRKFSWGIDFCGYIVLPRYILPRAKTKRRIFKKVLKSGINDQSLQSYLGYFSHANSYKITENLENIYWSTSEI
ncbi:MAG: Retron-type reverse transcriptase [Candidatus Curtissbacteria bacterium GW2011_GWA1_40_9]|uniref:Retron-type reverse transcriptase n=1 Tax=Candidatus Curtissbacteria bacterium GW2011_GWA1_40_9 TaxID=1618408 RepID=A0A0G0TM26_9BACT|nr:MAG: Retron-type reverse transcriptase [Candidatus Curtissbacteria bacterium GW2011_GWA1_40_9]